MSSPSSLFWSLRKRPARRKNSSPEATKPSIDYAPYARALKAYVNDKGLVYYKGLKKDSSDLNTFLSQSRILDRKVFGKWPETEQIAFLCNVYNARTLKAILDHYPIKASGISAFRFPNNSIRQIDGVWKKLDFLMMGDCISRVRPALTEKENV